MGATDTDATDAHLLEGTTTAATTSTTAPTGGEADGSVIKDEEEQDQEDDDDDDENPLSETHHVDGNVDGDSIMPVGGGGGGGNDDNNDYGYYYEDNNHDEVCEEYLVPAQQGLILSGGEQDNNNANNINNKSLHQSQHLTQHDLQQLEEEDEEEEEGPPSSATASALAKPNTSSTSSTTKKKKKEKNIQKACDLARKVYQKGFEESQSKLLDMTNNFPHFLHSEIVYGEVLGKGCFGTVNEVRGFNLLEGGGGGGGAAAGGNSEQQSRSSSSSNIIQQHLRRRSFDNSVLPRDNPDVADEEVPAGDLESRKFMAAHAFRNEGHARYAIKKLSPEIVQLEGEEEDEEQQQQQLQDETGATAATSKKKQLVQGIADLVLEAKILSVLEHPNIIKLRAIKAGDRFQPDFFLVLDRLYETLGQRMQVWRVSENKDSKNIFKHLKSRLIPFRHQKIAKAGSLSDRIVQAYHLSSALNYLHRQNNLIHRDIKPENVGFDVRGDIKIFDFGMAKEMPNRTPNSVYKFTGMCGSPRYMAPEVAHKRPYNEKADVYSFAILCYEILSLQPAFAQHTDFETMFAQVWGPPYRRPNLAKLRLPDTLYQLIYRAWHYDYRQRPSMMDMEDTLKKYIVENFPHISIQSLSHRRRKSKVIYDKEKCLFRVNSMLFDPCCKQKEYELLVLQKD